MTLFISKENQNLLYDMIHKTPEINTAFSSIEQKNEWFRNIIQNQYQSLPPNLTRELLLATNRQVLAYMVSSLRERGKSANQPNVQYTPIYDNPKPKAIDFSEKIEDEVITNMAELIEQQKRMRERELQEYTPPPPPIEKVNILEDLPKNVLQPTDLHLSTFKPPPSGTVINGVKDRHVRFEESSQLEERLSRIENKLDDLIRLFREHQQPIGDNVIKENISILKQMIREEEI